MQTQSKYLCRAILSLSLFLPAALSQPALAQQTVPIVSNQNVVLITAARTNLELIEKFTKVIELKTKILRVDGFDPTIIDVTTLVPATANQIRIQSLMQGVTSIVLTDEFNKSYVIDVFVKGDARHL